MKGKNFILIGGSSGIGWALVKKLSAAGAQTQVYSRTGETLSGIAGVTYHPLDITKEEFPADSLPATIHGLVYCPGSITLKPFRSLKPEQFQADFDINVLGAVKSLRAAYKGLKKSNNATVVLFSTVAVQQGMPFHASIAAAKGAVEGLARSLAAEWAPRIRVNGIAPSLTDTPLAKRLLSSADKREASGKRHPLGRVGQPEELAELALFLLSEKSSWMTGQIIGLDGGLSRLRT